MQAHYDDKVGLMLKFKEHELESDFWQSYELDLQSTIRTAIGISLVTWTMGLGLTAVVLPSMVAHVGLILLFAVYAPCILLILAARGDLVLGRWHRISGALNLIFGGLLIYFCSFFPHGTDMMLMLLIFIVFVGFYSYRLLLRMGMIVSGLYLLVFQVYIVYFCELDSAHLQILSFVTWLTMLFAFFAGYANERNARLIFIQQRTILRQKEEIESEKRASDKLLRNILPEEIALELQNTGTARPRKFEEATILFSDFQDFTGLVESIPTDVLIDELNVIFSRFDDIMIEEGVEKIETIGDAYLAAGGLPAPVNDHAIRCVKAGIKMIEFLDEKNTDSEYQWQIRIGLHTGPVTTGVVGKSKIAYDVFGDTINTANRIQTAGEAGRINISESTRVLIADRYACEARGAIHAKGKGDLEMYFIQGQNPV